MNQSSRIVCSRNAIPGVGLQIPALDGLRAVAILLVIPHNVDALRNSQPLAYPLAAAMHAGWIGVQLFFVLSGFLITSKLLDSLGSGNYFSAFFARRILRICPLYYVVLFCAFVLAPLLGLSPEAFRTNRHDQIWLWTFLSNWTQPFGAGVLGFGHFWSLAVEEQFYLLWPFVVLRCGLPKLLGICGTLTAGALLFRIAAVTAGFPDLVPYMFTIARMDALALGAAGAALLRIPRIAAECRRRSRLLTGTASVLFFAGAFFTRGYYMYDPLCETLGQTILAAVFAFTVLWAALPSQGSATIGRRLLSVAPLRLIGRYSYGMYVFHLPLHVFFGLPLLLRFAPKQSSSIALSYTVAILITSFILAALSYELFERPFLNLKRYFVPTAVG